MRRSILATAVLTACFAARAFAADEAASDKPKSIPAARPQIKIVCEALKNRQPRLPMPPEEVASNDRFSKVTNGRFRRYYLPKAWQNTAPIPANASLSSFNSDPAMSLTYALKTECFWIVSRGNNCHYCLGHQELKLAIEGLTDDQIGALDVDWTGYPAPEQAAFALARKLTLEPHTVTDADIVALREHFNDQQIIELVLSIAGNNSTNRWTDSLGLPQDQGFDNHPASFDAPTSKQFEQYASCSAPNPKARRPELETPEQVRQKLAACRDRQPRVALQEEDKAREVLGDFSSGKPLPQWVRALAWFPQAGVRQLQMYTAIKNEGRLSPALKAQIAWTTARSDRAWYALGDALARLAEQGVTEEQAFALDDLDNPARTPQEKAALAFARKLTETPYAMTDADIAGLREHYSDHEVAEIVAVTGAGNMFDRLTETLGLQLEAASPTGQ